MTRPDRPGADPSGPAANPGPGRAGAAPPMMRMAVAGAALLVIAGAGAFYAATRNAPAATDAAVHKVVVGPDGCTPADMTVPAGPATFEIHNASDRTLEWEILDGVMVLEERENIAPGFHARLTGRLKPGTYAITCGLLSAPRGVLTVTPSAASEAARAAPPLAAFVGPLSEYKVFLATQSAQLAAGAGRLDAAIRAGDLDAARRAWAEARLPYKRIEAVTGRIADLEDAIDPSPDYLAGREADPAFTGFHRIEIGLWGPDGTTGSTDGLAALSARLVADTTALKDRLRGLRLTPDALAASAARQAEHVAAVQIPQGEDRWSQLDLPEIEAALEGIAKPAGLMRPLSAEAAPAAAAAYDSALAAARAALDGTRSAQGYPQLSALDPQARAALAQRFAALGQAAAALNPAIGLD